MVSALLAAGGDRSAADQDGATPVAIASQEGHEAVLSVLLEASARSVDWRKEG